MNHEAEDLPSGTPSPVGTRGEHSREAVLTQGSVVGKMIRLTIPMIGGMFAMMAFHLTDTWFVSRLGVREMAAMGFAFPVVMVVHAISMGIGLGTASTISRAIGERNPHRVQRLATDGLLLTVLVVAVFSSIGLLTIDPLFTALGAKPDVLPLVREYMTIWYAGIAVAVIPMIANNAIRATGDTLTPSLIMVIVAGLNVILDPIMIFGWWGFPAMGIAGAALATVVSRAISLVAVLAIVHFKHHLIDFSRPKLTGVLRSWRRILHVGLPAALTNLLNPLANGIVVRLIAGYGHEVVAGFTAGGRVQMFSYIIPIAMGSALVPFIGQNWGARRYDRVRRGWWFSAAFGIVYGLICFGLAWFYAEPVARLFREEAAVVDTMTLYLLIILAGSGMQHLSVHTGFSLNAMGHPIKASLYNALRIAGLAVPLVILGNYLFGLKGVFGGMALANVLSGLIAIIWVAPMLSGNRAGTSTDPGAVSGAIIEEIEAGEIG